MDEAQKIKGGDLYVGSSQVRAPRCVWVRSGPESFVVEERSQGRGQLVYTTMVK